MRESRGEKRGVVQGIERGGSRRCRGVAGDVQGRRRQPGREEVAGARGRARRARARVLLAREEDDRGGSGGGLGRPAAVLGRFGYQVSAR